MHQDANVPLTYLRHKGHSPTCKFNDMKYRIFSLFYIAIVFVTQMVAEDGSHLWLRLPANAHAEISARSEERRVGKEGRSRWSPDH